MKVFISWSGERSQEIAEVLRDWLPNVVQAVQPWMSSIDIDKGARWNTDIALQLEETRVGIICLTSDNLESPWIHFEAGALSKTLEHTFVCPYLFDIEPTDVNGPLVQFQATRANEQETRKLIHTINRALGKEALSDNSLDRAFDMWWPSLSQSLKQIPSEPESHKPRRTERDLLEEILDVVRTQARSNPDIALPAEWETNEKKPDIAALTERERAVIALVCKGLKNRQISERLSISETTLRHHLVSIFSKLGVSDRLELVIFAYQEGIEKPPSLTNQNRIENA